MDIKKKKSRHCFDYTRELTLDTPANDTTRTHTHTHKSRENGRNNNANKTIEDCVLMFFTFKSLPFKRKQKKVK